MLSPRKALYNLSFCCLHLSNRLDQTNSLKRIQFSNFILRVEMFGRSTVRYTVSVGGV